MNLTVNKMVGKMVEVVCKLINLFCSALQR